MSVDQQAAAHHAADDEDHGFDTIGFLRRRKWLIALGLVVGVALAYVYFTQQPSVYQSSGQVHVQKPMARMPISGGVAMDPTLYKQDPLADDIFRIQSRQIVDPAVENYKLHRTRTLERSADPVSKIISGLKVRRVNDSTSLLEVRFTGKDPKDCREIVNAVIETYIADVKSQFTNSSQQMVDYLGRAKDDLNERLQEVEEEYLAFRKQSELLFEGNKATNLNLSHIQNTNAKLSELKLQQHSIEGKLESINKALQSKGKRGALQLMVDQTTGDDESGPGGALVNMTKEMFPLLLEEQLLLESLGQAHPKVRQVRKKIELTRSMLQELGMQQNGAGAKPFDPLNAYIESLQLELDTNKTEQEALQALLQEQTKAAKEMGETEVQLANLVARKERLEGMFTTVLTKLEDVELAADGGGYHAQVMAEAKNGIQISPNLPKIMTVGAILGALCGLLLGYVVESADQSFKSPEEISHLLGLQIIGHCPTITATGRPRDANGDTAVDPSVISYYRPKSRGAETFRGIRTSLYFSTRGANHKVIQITSPHPGDGKSTLSTNLAVSIAQSGKKTIIVDADFRRPRVHKIFGIQNEKGMSTAIAGEDEISDVIQQTPVANLDCLACGSRPDNPAELLTSARFEELLMVLRQKYDFVLVDSPPVLAVTDPAAVAARVDGVLLTVRMTKKARIDAVRATEALSQVDANILGIVVNGEDGSGGGGYGYNSRSYYGAGYMYGYGGGEEDAHPSHAKYFADDRSSTNGRTRRRRRART